MTGIDLLYFNIKNANKKKDTLNLKTRVKFQVGSYMDLPFPSEYFDGVFTLETLVHAPDYNKALKEFYRILKKGGKLVLFEYSIPPNSELNEQEKQIFNTIGEGSAMHSFTKFRHGDFPKILSKNDFANIQVEDITPRILPMLKKFSTMGFLPYQIIKILGQERRFVNTTSGVELYKYRDKFRYNIVTATKI